MQRPFRDASHGRNVEAWDWPRNSPNFIMTCIKCKKKLKSADLKTAKDGKCLKCWINEEIAKKFG